MQIHIAIAGQRQEPMSLEEINARLADGRLSIDQTLAWHEGCPDWIPLSQVVGVVLRDGSTPPPVPPPPGSRTGSS